MTTIAEAVYQGGYVIEFAFTDGHRNRVDFGPFLAASPNPMTRLFRDPAQFRAFRIEKGRAIVWGNDQAMSFGVDSIYNQSPQYKPVSPQAVADYMAYLGQ